MPAVEAGAKLYVAGWNVMGACGVDPRTSELLQPVPVSGLGALAGAAVEQIAQGCDFTLLLILGRLYHAGSNLRGQRGHGRWDNDFHPDFAEIPLRALAVEVVCGLHFALALLQNGTLMSWGSNGQKQLGRGGDKNTPLPVVGLGEVRHVYAGSRFAFVLLAGGEVRAWGSNEHGQLCLGRTGTAEGSPQRVDALCGAVALALSDCAGIALLTDDSAVAWGNLDGNLADGTGGWDAERGCVPLRLRLSAVRAVGAGCYFLCAHLKDGRLVSWGGSSSALRGLGRDGPAHVPTAVPFPGDVPITEFFCLSFCLFANGPSGWAACGDGWHGLPFSKFGIGVRCLTLIPRPWVPCPRQGGPGAKCAFYVRAASESVCASLPAFLTPRRTGDKRKREDGDDAATLGPPAAAAAAAAGTAAPRTLAEAGAATASMPAARRLEAKLAAAEKERTAAAEAATALRDKVAELERVVDEVRADGAARLRAAEAGLAEQREAGARAAAEAAAALAEQRAAAERAAEEAAAAQGKLERQLAALRERLAATEAPAPESVQRYFEPYAKEFPARSPAQVDAIALSFLLQCPEIHGAGAEKEFIDMYEHMKGEVDARFRVLKDEGEDFGDTSETAARMTLYWSTDATCCANFEGRPKEFCGWINLALVHKESDRPLRRAMAVIRTLNEFCVTVPKPIGGAAAPPEERWAGPAMKETWAKIRRNGWKLYRGGGLLARHKDWFVPERVYRQPRYVPASLKQEVADEFAKREGAKKDCIPVVWEIEIDPDRHCCHMNYLGTKYSFFAEEELLFAPCSVFTVKAVTWAPPGSTSRITLCAAPDNKDHALDLPMAPWS